MWKRWKTCATEVWRRSSQDGVSDYAASLSYRMLLAMFPFAIFLASAGALAADLLRIDNPTDQILARLGSALPDSARPLLEDQLQSVLETRSGSLLSFGIVGAIWSASGGISAAIRAMNEAYDVKEARPFWKRTLLAIALTVLSAIFLIGAFTIIVAGEALAGAIVDALGLGESFRFVVRLTQFILVVAMVLVAVDILYWAAPAGRRALKWTTPGAVLFVVGWLAASFVFSQYVGRFGSYEATYGTLGGVVVLMLWLYITGYLLLFGAELNGLVTREARATEAEREAQRLAGAATRARVAAERESGRGSGPAHDPSGRGDIPLNGATDHDRPFARTGLGQLTGTLVAAGTLVRAVRSAAHKEDGEAGSAGSPRPSSNAAA